jgi:hypothetical protein
MPNEIKINNFSEICIEKCVLLANIEKTLGTKLKINNFAEICIEK